MAQHIGVLEVGELGNTIRESNINFALVNKTLTKLPEYKENFPWVATIDEYGDTIFNYLQLSYVMAELDDIKVLVKDERTLEQINLLQEFVGNIDSHKYIKFIGD